MAVCRLISVGDRFPFSRFEEIHSRFEAVINFTYRKQVVSVVTPEVEKGPFNLSLDFKELSSVQTVEYRAGCVILNDCIGFPVLDEQIYNSEFDFSSMKKTQIEAGVKKIKEILLKSDKAILATGLMTDMDTKQLSRFDGELLSQLRQAYKFLVANDYVKAAKAFRGRGYGQSPSGDDFLAGLLIGFKLRAVSEKKELSKIQSSIYHISLGKNLLANTFLLQAQSGLFSENWHRLLAAITGGKEALEESVRAILNQGETSGADTLAGFVSAWEIKL